MQLRTMEGKSCWDPTKSLRCEMLRMWLIPARWLIESITTGLIDFLHIGKESVLEADEGDHEIASQPLDWRIFIGTAMPIEYFNPGQEMDASEDESCHTKNDEKIAEHFRALFKIFLGDIVGTKAVKSVSAAKNGTPTIEVVFLRCIQIFQEQYQKDN